MFSVIEVAHKFLFGSFLARPDPALLFPKASPAVFAIFLVVNCFFEEAIVRAFLMTEVAQLTGSMRRAAVASVVLQSSYHAYQGWLNLLGLAAVFTVFALYFARKQKLLPVYIAHLAMDAISASFFIFGR